MCQSPPPESRKISSGVTMLTLSSSNLIHSSEERRKWNYFTKLLQSSIPSHFMHSSIPSAIPTVLKKWSPETTQVKTISGVPWRLHFHNTTKALFAFSSFSSVLWNVPEAAQYVIKQHCKTADSATSYEVRQNRLTKM